jgi:hypothetical protein
MRDEPEAGEGLADSRIRAFAGEHQIAVRDGKATEEFCKWWRDARQRQPRLFRPGAVFQADAEHLRWRAGRAELSIEINWRRHHRCCGSAPAGPITELLPVCINSDRMGGEPAAAGLFHVHQTAVHTGTGPAARVPNRILTSSYLASALYLASAVRAKPSSQGIPLLSMSFEIMTPFGRRGNFSQASPSRTATLSASRR